MDPRRLAQQIEQELRPDDGWWKSGTEEATVDAAEDPVG